ncbi:MAG TPA: FAD-dependent oxidoreductase [Cyanothece sp. UBA12306]|nr:FAD-dependent oxidoreductase [Cyanothece sp. UBA12306]
MGKNNQDQPKKSRFFEPGKNNKSNGIPRVVASLSLIFFCGQSILASLPAIATPSRKPDETVKCDLLVVGGGLAGSATAYEALLAGRNVCLTDISDWVGGQISSQGNSALDEGNKQRSLQHFPKGYQMLRKRIASVYGTLNPGDCWVSESCFLPYHGHQILYQQLRQAERLGRGRLEWFPNTVIKDLELTKNGKQIEGAIAIQHSNKIGTRPLNYEPLSAIIDDVYDYKNSQRLNKKIIRFGPKFQRQSQKADWFVVEATETGEIIPLAGVPYRVGLDPRSHLNPSSPTTTGDPYCTQGFTYTFAMQQTEEAQPQYKPAFYEQYAPYYGYDPNRALAYFDLLFTYRRIWSPKKGRLVRTGRMKINQPTPGDISMQNWLWGNDYRPGTKHDNLIYTHDQLEKTGQLQPGGWKGGLRQETLRKGEELALGFYYWLVQGTTDSHLGYGIKKPYPNHRFLKGLDSPMGTVHGLSKYPYIREARRIIGRPSVEHPEGFSINEIDISTRDYWHDFYRTNLPRPMYENVRNTIAHLESKVVNMSKRPSYLITRRTHATVYDDSVGVHNYMIDFHPCMASSPPEKPMNRERENVRIAHGESYPAQIPLRALIPQKIDNLIVAGKSIATSHIAAATYRVHGFEWSVGAAAGNLANLALLRNALPYEFVDNLPNHEPLLVELRRRLEATGNPTTFPRTLLSDAYRRR